MEKASLSVRRYVQEESAAVIQFMRCRIADQSMVPDGNNASVRFSRTATTLCVSLIQFFCSILDVRIQLKDNFCVQGAVSCGF